MGRLQPEQIAVELVLGLLALASLIITFTAHGSATLMALAGGSVIWLLFALLLGKRLRTTHRYHFDE